ncbi:hypothetical protein [Natronosalvus caseinilyticus]|uniref:hypothetical protein n=1 Tax=Natronosalvus caseinilyticus TaxID=2953747 RepID=UPI0028AA8CF2|nr:hypothetical protein [Natronosalvus caseinilyticus]
MPKERSQATSITDHSWFAQRLLRILENFADEFSRRNAPAHFEQVATNDTIIDGTKIGQEPERFVEEHLIWPTLEAFGYEYWPQPYYYPRWDRLTPDFGIQNFDCRVDCTVFGEVKTPNNVDEAQENVTKYLNSDCAEPAIAFATDGVFWRIVARPPNAKAREIATLDLADAFALLPRRHKEQENYNAFQTRQLMGDVDVLRKSAVEKDASQHL